MSYRVIADEVEDEPKYSIAKADATSETNVDPIVGLINSTGYSTFVIYINFNKRTCAIKTS